MSPAAYADSTALRFKGHAEDTQSSVGLKNYDKRQQTELMVLSTDTAGSPEVLVYCIDLETRIRDVDYNEGTWGESWLKDTARVAKINWVLNNSYPKVTSLKALAGSANVSTKDLTKADVVAATQAAIWHYSNGADVAEYRNDDDVNGIYKYLTGPANQGLSTEPTASLELSPEATAGKDGDTPGIGPVTVKTTGTEPVAVTLNGKVPAGVSLVGKDGAPISTATNGSELYVKVPKGQKPGSVEIGASTKAGVNIGRVFLGDNREATQTLIAAGSQPFSVKTKASVTWKHEAVPVPTVAYKEDCVQGGVTVTLTNNGDAKADFKVNGKKVTVPANSSKTHFVKVAEDAEYSIKVTGPAKFSETYTGKLDCLAPPVTPTEPPVTETPTTEPPVTESPSTEPPVTESPSTEPPVTESPSTEPPVTESPSTEPPVTESPSTEPPVTESPSTEPPVTESPSTEPPVTESPSTEPPVTESPSTEPPVTESPSTEPPTGEPSTSAPAATTEPSASSTPTATGPEPTGTEGPVEPITEPNVPDKPIVVPWLPVSNDTDLAETGGDSSTPIMIGGAAAALLIAGGGAVYFNRRRGAHQA